MRSSESVLVNIHHTHNGILSRRFERKIHAQHECAAVQIEHVEKKSGKKLTPQSAAAQ